MSLLKPLRGHFRAKNGFRGTFLPFYPPISLPPLPATAQIVFCIQTPPICDQHEQHRIFPLHNTSLQKRRNSQLTHGWCDRGASGMTSRSTISRIAATTSRTSPFSRSVNTISSAFLVTSE